MEDDFGQDSVNGGLMDGWHALKRCGEPPSHALSGRATPSINDDRALVYSAYCTTCFGLSKEVR
jgi:hypothetical protein